MQASQKALNASKKITDSGCCASCRVGSSYSQIFFIDIELEVPLLWQPWRGDVFVSCNTGHAAACCEASNACDCWSWLNGSHTAITCSVPLGGLSLFDMFDPQRHDIPSVIAPCDPRQLSTQPLCLWPPNLSESESNHAWLSGAWIKGGDPRTEALKALLWRERSEFQDSNNTC